MATFYLESIAELDSMTGSSVLSRVNYGFKVINPDKKEASINEKDQLKQNVFSDIIVSFIYAHKNVNDYTFYVSVKNRKGTTVSCYLDNNTENFSIEAIDHSTYKIYGTTTNPTFAVTFVCKDLTSSQFKSAVYNV